MQVKGGQEQPYEARETMANNPKVLIEEPKVYMQLE